MRYARFFSKITKYHPSVNDVCGRSLRPHWTGRYLSSSSAAERVLPPSYFLTTPIFYVNSVPHLGHLYSTVLADCVSRWYRILGIPVTFSTGTDEHGLKIQQAASLNKKDPREFCDTISSEFQRLFHSAQISHTDFIRTTEDRHIRAVTAFWNCLCDGGYLYKGSYEGWYSTSDEAFLSDDQITDGTDKQGNPCKISFESGNPVEWMKEENYMFRLSQFTDQLSQWLLKGVVQPANFEPIVHQWLKDGLPDLSVSRQRERLRWGIPVPGDPSQTIYVWLDALINYLTVTGFPETRPNELRWPCDCHVVGKDILKFHAIYWPAFLMAAGLEPPRQIQCHSHWTIDHHKMSKSRGNVVDPFKCIDMFTADGLRYFLMKEGVPHSDGNYSHQKVVDCVNSDLSNTLGNLLNRCTATSLNPQQSFPRFESAVFLQRASQEDKEMIERLKSLPDLVDNCYRNFTIYKGLEAIANQLRLTNGFIQTHKPWDLRKVPEERDWLQTVLHVSMETLRVSGILLQPVIPGLADKILRRLNVSDGERSWSDLQHILADTNSWLLGPDCGPLFPRIR